MFLNCMSNRLLMSIMKNLKYQNRCQNWDFSHPDCILVGIKDFQAKYWDGWTVCINGYALNCGNKFTVM